MPIKSNQSDPIAAAKRRSVAERRMGVGTACVCGENRPLALIPGSNPVSCAKCKRRKKGRSAYDRHHVAGKANHPLTIPVPVNDHRAVLSEDQYEWPRATRENPDRSPLLIIAGCIRGLYKTIVYLLDELLLWIAEYLERLDDFMTSHLGAKWWTNKLFSDFLNGEK
jgi:hypothetical protein